MALEEKRRDALKAAAEERARDAAKWATTMAGVGGSVADAFTTAYNAAEQGQDALGMAAKAAGQQAINSALDVMEAKVTAFAAEAAAGAASSQAGIPFIGPVLAAAAASTMFALVKGFIALGFQGGHAEPQGAAKGGLVKGGVANRDSVPLMLMPGELIIPKKEVVSPSYNSVLLSCRDRISS